MAQREDWYETCGLQRPLGFEPKEINILYINKGNVILHKESDFD